MNKHEESTNSPQTNMEDERLAAVLKAAYPTGEASTALKQRVADSAAQRSTPGILHRLKMPVMVQRRLASAFIIFAALYLALAYTYPGRSTKVFGQVEVAMRDFKTAHWIETHRSTSPDGTLFWEDVDSVWVRLNPPAREVRSVSHKIGPGVKSEGGPSTGIRMVTTPNRSMAYNPNNNKYLLVPTRIPADRIRAGDTPATYLRNTILAQVLSPKGGGDKFSVAITKPLPPWTSERVTLAGQSVIKFYREYKAPGYDSFKDTIWADPLTHRVVRSERETVTGNIRNHSINEQYRYDQEPPKGTFDLTPPKGAVMEELKR